MEGAAVIDANNYALTASRVGSADSTAQGKRAMRGGQSLRVEGFATCGRIASQLATIMARLPFRNGLF